VYVANVVDFVFSDALNVFNDVIDVCNEPVSVSKTYLLSNELVNCEEPLIVPDGVVPLTTLPLNVYRVSYDDVNCEEPDIVPAGMVVDELINPNAVICADELNKFEGNG
jgi:hypothetical protein